MAKKSKSKQSSIDNEELPNKASRNVALGLSWRDRPINDAYLENMADELEEWALNSDINKDKPYSLEAFYHPKKIDVKTFAEWRARNKRLGEAAEFAKEIIGRRRFEITFEMERDKSLFCITQPDYDPTWREKQRNYTADTKAPDVKKDEQEKTVTVKIIRE
jgi:hypothetical protein